MLQLDETDGIVVFKALNADDDQVVEAENKFITLCRKLSIVPITVFDTDDFIVDENSFALQRTYYLNFKKNANGHNNNYLQRINPDLYIELKKYLAELNDNLSASFPARLRMLTTVDMADRKMISMIIDLSKFQPKVSILPEYVYLDKDNTFSQYKAIDFTFDSEDQLVEAKLLLSNRTDIKIA